MRLSRIGGHWGWQTSTKPHSIIPGSECQRHLLTHILLCSLLFTKVLAISICPCDRLFMCAAKLRYIVSIANSFRMSQHDAQFVRRKLCANETNLPAFTRWPQASKLISTPQTRQQFRGIRTQLWHYVKRKDNKVYVRAAILNKCLPMAFIENIIVDFIECTCTTDLT